jgi:hypothetical protein
MCVITVFSIPQRMGRKGYGTNLLAYLIHRLVLVCTSILCVFMGPIERHLYDYATCSLVVEMVVTTNRRVGRPFKMSTYYSNLNVSARVALASHD